MSINKNYVKKEKVVSDLIRINQDLLAITHGIENIEQKIALENQLEMLSSVIAEVKGKAIRDNSYIEAPKRMFQTGQRGQILKYMQENPEEEVCSIYFSDKEQCRKRGVQLMAGSSAGGRLSELARWGLIEESGIIPGKATFNKKSKDRTLYRITSEGLKYKLL